MDEHVTALAAEPLRGLASYTGYRQEGLAPGVHRGLPSPYLTMIVTLDQPITVAMGQSLATYGSLIGGLHATPAFITHDGAQSGIQINLSPLGARALLGLPAGELSAADYEAADVLGSVAHELHSRIRAAPDWSSRFGVVDSILLRLLDRSGVVTPADEVVFAWRRLLSTRGAVSIGELAGQTGWSARYLHSRFQSEIGLSPKVAARVVRFDRTRRILQTRASAGVPLDLAGLATAGGYFDQAHLDRDFREFAGCPPTRWLADEFRNVQAWPAPVEHDEFHDNNTSSAGVA